MEGMEDHFPAERRQRGGYALVGGGAAVGNSALCLAYVMGYRRFEVFGYDSSHRGEASHAYDQPMNRFIPVAEVEWGGRTYRSSVAMKAQAEKFQITGQALVQQGCTINVHGDGLLPAMWNTQAADLTERDKYRLMADGQLPRSPPGADAVPTFLEVVKPDGLILDFGCGTGRAALALHDAGHDVLLIDFADNCRDEEAAGLPFLEWDLTRELLPPRAVRLCCDVMEHIPPESVDTVIRNIAGRRGCFFQISRCPTSSGDARHVAAPDGQAGGGGAASSSGSAIASHGPPRTRLPPVLRAQQGTRLMLIDPMRFAHLNVTFFTDAVHNVRKSAEEDRLVYDDVDFVRITDRRRSEEHHRGARRRSVRRGRRAQPPPAVQGGP